MVGNEEKLFQLVKWQHVARTTRKMRRRMTKRTVTIFFLVFSCDAVIINFVVNNKRRS